MPADDPADPTAAIIEATQAAYAFATITDLVPNPHTWGGRFVATFVADGEKYLLKEYPWFSRTPERIAFVLRAQDLARAAGLPVPEVVATRTGTRTLTVGERRLFLQRHVGRACEPGRRTQRQVALRLLGRLHRVLADFPPDGIAGRPEAPLRAAVDRMLGYYGKVRNSLLGNAGSADERDELDAVLGRIAASLRNAADALAASPDDLPVSVLHGDFQLFNLRFAGDRVVAVVDWDAVWFGPRLLELAGAIAIMFGKAWDEEYARDRVWRYPVPVGCEVLDDCVALYEGDGQSLGDAERALLPRACALAAGQQLAGFYRQPYPSPAAVVQVSDLDGCRNLGRWIDDLMALDR